MENIDITSKVKNFIRFGLAGLLILSGAIGYGMFQHYHAEKILTIILQVAILFLSFIYLIKNFLTQFFRLIEEFFTT